MSWPLSFKWEGKPQFCSVKTYASEHNLPPEKELIGISSILAPGKSQVLPADPLFTCKTDYIYNLADRRSAINRQEGEIVASKVCLKALPLSLPSFPNFFALSPNREPVHRLYVQRAKKVVSNSPGLVDFAIGLVIFVLNLPDRQVLFYGEL